MADFRIVKAWQFQPAIACCSEACCSPVGRRRLALRWLSALAGAAAGLAHADDLLDPSLILRKPAANMPGQALPAQSRTSGPASPRGMADSVVDSLDMLAGAAGDRAAAVDRLGRRIAELDRALANLRQKRDRVMEEYRQGLFCSGCGKTKSEILAAGQAFPHPGQSIIRATPQQIQSKDREMQDPIDRADMERRDSQIQRGKLIAERDEALAQIDAGLSLWSTSLTFETLQLDAQKRQIQRNFQASRDKLEQQIVAARTAKPAQALVVQRLQAQMDQITSDHVAAVRANGRARNDASTQAGRDEERLNAYLSREALRELNIPRAHMAFMAQTAGFNVLGGMYRMGAFDAAHSGDTLPQVEAFIDAFRQAPPLDLPAQQGGTMDMMRDKLNELLKCAPDKAGDCVKPKNVGTGVRG